MAKNEDDKFNFATPQHMPVNSPEAPDGGENGNRIIDKIIAKGDKVPEYDTHRVYATQERSMLDRIRLKDPVQPIPRDEILAGHQEDQDRNRKSAQKVLNTLTSLTVAVQPIVLAYEQATDTTLQKKFKNQAVARTFKIDEPEIYDLARRQMQSQLAARSESNAKLQEMSKAYRNLRNAAISIQDALDGAPPEHPDRELPNIAADVKQLGAVVKGFTLIANRDHEKLPPLLKPKIQQLLKANSIVLQEEKTPTITPEDHANAKHFVHEGSFQTREMLKAEAAARSPSL